MRYLGKAARVFTETLLLPVVLVLSIEAWWRLSAPKDECHCGCGWEE